MPPPEKANAPADDQGASQNTAIGTRDDSDAAGRNERPWVSGLPGNRSGASLGFRNELSWALRNDDRFRSSKPRTKALLLVAVGMANIEGDFWPGRARWAAEAGELHPDLADASRDKLKAEHRRLVENAEQVVKRAVREAEKVGLLVVQQRKIPSPTGGAIQRSNIYSFDIALVARAHFRHGFKRDLAERRRRVTGDPAV